MQMAVIIEQMREEIKTCNAPEKVLASNDRKKGLDNPTHVNIDIC